MLANGAKQEPYHPVLQDLRESLTFTKHFVQLFNLQQIALNPTWDPSVLPIQYPMCL